MTATITSKGPMAERLPPTDGTRQLVLTQVDRELFLGVGKQAPTPVAVVFFDFDGDVPRRMHFGARTMTTCEATA